MKYVEITSSEDAEKKAKAFLKFRDASLKKVLDNFKKVLEIFMADSEALIYLSHKIKIAAEKSSLN